MRKANVLIVGTGGVGIIAALALETNGGSDVTCIVSSDYEKATTRGYNIKSLNYGNFESWKPKHIVKSAEVAVQYGPFDYIVISAKNVPDNNSRPQLEDQIGSVVTSNKTVIILIQNGVGIEEPFFIKYPNNVVLSGITKVGSTNYKCDVIQKGYEEIHIGAFNNPNIEQLKQKKAVDDFISLYKNPKTRVFDDPNVKQSRWEKLIYNSSLNTICGLSGMDTSRIMIGGARESLLEPIIDEIYEIAKSDGVIMDPKWKKFYIEMELNNHFYSPSMLVDIQYDRLCEAEIIVGNPLRVARRNGVKTPVYNTIYSLLKLVQLRIKEKNGMIKIDDTRRYDDTSLIKC